MIKMVEAFSGIGSQVKALKNLNVDVDVLATVEWDVNAIYAYDIIHNGKQNLDKYNSISRQKIINDLSVHTLSYDGKKPMNKKSLSKMNDDTLKRIHAAIERTKNKISIADLKDSDLPEMIDLLTYSFPCQDLSMCGYWHGNKSGIDRDANNRSGMLWEVERILMERKTEERKMPRYLLMENVSSISSKMHVHNFNEWKAFLEELGYHNEFYMLNSLDFGIPQNRPRAYMLSVWCESEEKRKEISKYMFFNQPEKSAPRDIMEFLRLDYSNPVYRKEADLSQPNDTPSRRRIKDDNRIIYDGKKFLYERITTITTKQDRNPNSGLILYNNEREGKSDFRYITPRECFLFMGFDEEDYDRLIDNNFMMNTRHMFITDSKLIKMAGNSIVVNVLEAIFSQMIKLDRDIFGIDNSKDKSRRVG